MNLLASIRPLILAGCAAFAAFSTCAEVVVYQVSPTQSTLSIAGTVASIPIQQQGDGSLVESYGGVLVLDESDSTIQMLLGSQIFGQGTNSWNPGPPGVIGPAPADYGVTGSAGSGFELKSITAALRRLSFGITNTPVAFTNNQFDSSSLVFSLDPTPKPVVDYDYHELVSIAGESRLAGVATNNADIPSQFGIAIESQKLTVPVDTTFNFKVRSDGDSAVQFTGQLVAFRGMVLFPQLIWLPAADGQSIYMVWDTRFKLQRATRLVPADWADYAADGPVTVSLSDPVGFFRVVIK